MTLRDRYLSLRVAPPRECNNATSAPGDATARATPAQQTAPLHRVPEATADATTAQQATERHATTAQQIQPVTQQHAQQDQRTSAASAPALRAAFDLLRVAGARECNTQQRKTEVAAALTDAINRACDVRGDDDENRAGLLADCAALPPEAQADMLAHFVVEGARWGAVHDPRGFCGIATFQHCYGFSRAQK